MNGDCLSVSLLKRIAVGALYGGQYRYWFGGCLLISGIFLFGILIQQDKGSKSNTKDNANRY